MGSLRSNMSKADLSFFSPKTCFYSFDSPMSMNHPPFICFSVLVSSLTPTYKHPHPSNPHGFNFLLFLDSMYKSVSLVWLWLRLLPILISLLTMFITSLGFSSSLFSTQSCLTNRQIWWFIHLFNEYVLSPYCGPGVRPGVWDTVLCSGNYSLWLQTADNVKETNYFKNYKWYKWYKGNKQETL